MLIFLSTSGLLLVRRIKMFVSESPKRLYTWVVISMIVYLYKFAFLIAMNLLGELMTLTEGDTDW